MQTKLDAQSEVLRCVADRMNIDDDDEDLLTRIVGVEGWRGSPEKKRP